MDFSKGNPHTSSNNQLIPEDLRSFVEEETGLRLLIDTESDPKKFQDQVEKKPTQYDLLMAPIGWLIKLQSSGRLAVFENKILNEISINKDFNLNENSEYILPLYWFQSQFITSSKNKIWTHLDEILKQSQIDRIEILDHNPLIEQMISIHTDEKSKPIQNWLQNKNHQLQKISPFNSKWAVDLNTSIIEIPHTQLYQFKNSIIIEEYFRKPWSRMYIWGLGKPKGSQFNDEIYKIIRVMGSSLFITKLMAETPWASTSTLIESFAQIPNTRKPSYLRNLKLNTNHKFE